MAEPGDSCPNCVLPEQKREKAPQQQTSDEIRLETIKRQILSKLGLKEKPNVTSPVPREVIMETLNRADEMLEQHDGSGSHHVMYEDDSAIPSSTRPPESEPDDFYGRTSEIIAFAEPGRNATCPVSRGTQYVPLETPFIHAYCLDFLLCNENYRPILLKALKYLLIENLQICNKLTCRESETALFLYVKFTNITELLKFIFSKIYHIYNS